ncbi:hypothetical protein GCM10009119_19460 [Algoriphagus jejuensis]|uniref:Uncharacterized protein n=1 Tax=Algoriphagus jejuensis TaxID=419934 RepID=A0ABN1N099_9BACT
MTNLERYFGIKVQFKQVLDPLKFNYLRAKAINLTALTNFNIENFFVYVHTMNIHINQNHFASKMPLTDRIDELEVRFCVNPKQVAKGQIRFYNDLADIDLPEGVETSYGDTQLTKYYPGTLLNKRKVLKTELITYIDKSLVRESHKKIKVHIKAFPSDSYKDLLKESHKEEFRTSIDLKLTRNVQLVIDFPIYSNVLTEEELHEIKKELELLHQRMEAQDVSSKVEDLQLLKNAIKASETGEERKLKIYLKNMGELTCNVAEEMGLHIVMKLI